VKRDTASWSIKVQRPLLSAVTATKDWRIKLVTVSQYHPATGSSQFRSDNCDGDQSTLIKGDGSRYNAGPWEPDTTDLDEATWALTHDTTDRSINGLYLVCFCSVDPVQGSCDSWTPLPASTGSVHFEIEPTTADLAPAANVFHNQRWSAKVGRTFELVVSGAGLADADGDTDTTFGVAQSIIYIAEQCSITHATVGTAAAPRSTATTFVDAASVKYTIATTDAFTPRSATASRPQGHHVCFQKRSDTNNGNLPNGAVRIGTIFFTARADLDRSFIFDPSMSQAIEVSGAGLTTADRIMLLDCQQSCGIGHPSAEVLAPATPCSSTALETFNSFPPRPMFAPAIGTDNPAEAAQYTATTERYCVGHAINVVGNGNADVVAAQCHGRCAGGAVDGCDGYFAGYDDANSNALCLTRMECEQLCTALGAECSGVDMHRTLPRCFLNREGCATQVAEGTLGVDTNYDFLLRDTVTAVAPSDWTAPDGLSSSCLLRFNGVQFRSGGRYKVCFCDSTLLRPGQTDCQAEEDYSVTLGEVFVSGVSCLLDDPRFRKVDCTNMAGDGGLACGTYFSPACEEPVAATGAPALPSSFGAVPAEGCTGAACTV